MRCVRCDKEMVPKKTTFTYLGHEMHHDVPRCPSCGLAFIDEALADGKIAKVEELLEDK